MKELIDKHLEDFEYKEDFDKDLEFWQATFTVYLSQYSSIEKKYKLTIKEKDYPLAGKINFDKVERVLAETVERVTVMSYMYGVVGNENAPVYKKIHACKFISVFMYYFMLYLPLEIDLDKDNDIRYVNALFVRMIGFLAKRNESEAQKVELKEDMDPKLLDEFLHGLTNNYFKTAEELYLFCRAFNIKEIP